MRETVRRERVRRSRALLAVVPVAVFVLIFGGSLAYFGLSDGDGSADEHGLENGSGDLWLANGDGSGETRLLGGDEDDSSAPRSPDGRRIALLRDSRLAIINADGTSLRRLTGCGS
jgi:Tol biopolymer transport system component